MLLNRFQNRLTQLFSLAQIEIDGSNPWDIQVHNNQFYRRVLADASLGLGEAYMDKWWDCEQLDNCISRVLRADLHNKVTARNYIFNILAAKLINFQKGSGAWVIGKKHYDIGNSLYRYMLGDNLIYSCGYWKDAGTLEEAQEAKLDLVCRKLNIQPGIKVLDIGCGWGGTAKFIAERYQAEVVGITVSKEQVLVAEDMCKGLPVEIRLQDYRSLEGCFDRILSIGMFEHVGYKNYRVFMETARRCLKDDGLFLLHTIGRNRSTKVNDPWIDRYIFPNSMLPSARQICTASEGLFVAEDWHNFGPDYDKTLMQWYKNFNHHWDSLKDRYGERFYRMWKYYLLSSAGAFRARTHQVWQVVYSHKGIPGGYVAPR